MNKRRQPFGYQICGGRVAVKCSEADIVKYIFRAYPEKKNVAEETAIEHKQQNIKSVRRNF